MNASEITVGSTAPRVAVYKDSIVNDLQSKSSPNVDRWIYPEEIADDLRGIDISTECISEILNSAWEYTRIVIPHFTNYTRYIAFCRLIVVAVIAEFKGSLFSMSSDEQLFGYDIKALLRTVFDETVYYDEMCREFRCFLYFTAQKSSEARASDQFRQYANCLAHSPQTWFRFRDCDGLVRFIFGGALACNDYNNTWFKESELQLLSEISVTMYDAMAYYKHRAEGETHSTFGYVESSLRTESYRQCREILWELDAAWVGNASHRCIINLIRNFSGPLHITCRRYRFVEDSLTIGQPENEERVQDARENVKLWCRIEAKNDQTERLNAETFHELEKQERLFEGFSEIFHDYQINKCNYCLYPQSYGTKKLRQFNCVQLCEHCRSRWYNYVIDVRNRSKEIFPFIQSI